MQNSSRAEGDAIAAATCEEGKRFYEGLEAQKMDAHFKINRCSCGGNPVVIEHEATSAFKQNAVQITCSVCGKVTLQYDDVNIVFSYENAVEQWNKDNPEATEENKENNVLDEFYGYMRLDEDNEPWFLETLLKEHGNTTPCFKAMYISKILPDTVRQKGNEEEFNLCRFKITYETISDSEFAILKKKERENDLVQELDDVLNGLSSEDIKFLYEEMKRRLQIISVDWK